MYIHQYLLSELETLAQPGKVTIIYGPRRVGKTTLLHKYLADKQNYLLVNGEDRFVQQELSSQSIQQLKLYVGKYDFLVIDEAQKIDNIGLNLKLCVDNFKNLTIIATGSSSFDLNKHVGEPLTGRKNVLKMFPLSQIELSSIEDAASTKANLESRLVYGSYPEVVLAPSNEYRREYLLDLVNSYLCKDLLEVEGIKKSKKIIDLLQLIALQVGKEVSENELATRLGINKKTVAKYLDVLEQSFVLIRLNGFSRNLRKEVTKSSIYYFYDTGIRNAIINNFNQLSARADIGEIWENYLVIERLKKQSYMKLYKHNYFWRTYDQQEIDWIEEGGGKLDAYEFKWRKNNVKPPRAWLKAYPGSNFALINQENYIEFII
jgi:predicted AAA+ superfamily ATPase